VHTQLRLCRPAEVARQNRTAIWSCAVQGCAHAEQPAVISPLVGDSVGITCVSVVAMPLPLVLCVISSGVGHTERLAMVSLSPLYAGLATTRRPARISPEHARVYRESVVTIRQAHFSTESVLLLVGGTADAQDGENEMTKVFTRAPATTRLPTLPDGWPISSYDTYKEAQQAVEHLADNDFPVRGVTIVGIDLVLVEHVDAQLTWRRVLAIGAVSGAWLGLFVGLLLSLFTPGRGLLPIMIGLFSGVVFGLASAAIRYASARGQRNFVSHSQLVGGRYDVLCQPGTAEQARGLLAARALRDN
jgi:hypothetical protein